MQYVSCTETIAYLVGFGTNIGRRMARFLKAKFNLQKQIRNEETGIDSIDDGKEE